MCTALLLSAHPLSFVSHSEHILYAVDKDAHDQYDLFRLIHNLLPRINPFVFFIFPLLYTMHKLNRYVPIEEGCLKAAPAGGHYLKRERDRGTVLGAEAEEWLCGASALDGQFKG